jgi:hypothetical protein
MLRTIDDLDTGDILLFDDNASCKSCCLCITSFLDCCIKCCSRSRYTHAALVIKDPPFGPEELKGYYCLESTGLEPVRDVEDHQIKFGVQLRKLQEVVDDFDGKVWVRKLYCTRDAKFTERLKLAHSMVHNRPYDILPDDWLRALFDLHVGKLQRRKTFFCSALVAFVYVCWGFLPSNTPWSIVRPKDLGTERGRHNVEFVNCHVEKEARFK